jgi:hypothetical protein
MVLPEKFCPKLLPMVYFGGRDGGGFVGIWK